MGDFDEYEYLERQYDRGHGPSRQDSYQHSSRGYERYQDESYKGYERYQDDDYNYQERNYRGRGRGYMPSEREYYREEYGDDYRKRPHRDQNQRGGRGRYGEEKRMRGRSPERKKAPTLTAEERALRDSEKELKELERPTRAVFAYNINLKADDKDIFQFFSKAGKVTDVKLITDRHTKRSKGFAYIEFAKQEDTLNALSLTGQVFMGQAVMVKPSEAEKNLAWEAQQQAAQNKAAAAGLLGSITAPPTKLYVGNLHLSIAENDLRTLFEPFGSIETVQVVKDNKGTSQGYGYVQYKTAAEATAAMSHWNGKQVAGMAMKITVVPASGNADMSAYGATISELDEDEENGGGLKLTSTGRAALMNRLASSAGLQTPSTASGAAGQSGAKVDSNITLEQGLLGPASPIPTVCLLLKNMFSPQEESGPNWDEDIAGDVKEECGKYGPVVHIHVDKSSKGFVYIKFGNVESAQAAQRILHGRFFAGRQILAEYQFLQMYNIYFKI